MMNVDFKIVCPNSKILVTRLFRHRVLIATYKHVQLHV